MKQYKATNGLIVGWMKDGIFRKTVQGSIHLLKVMEAWGIDVAIVDELMADKCTEIRIFDVEAELVYAVSFEDFCAKAVERNFVGKQLFLPKKYFTTYEHKPRV